MSDEVKMAALKNKEAKLAFDLAVSEIPSLKDSLFEAVLMSLEVRKSAKTAKKALPQGDLDPKMLAALSKFKILFAEILKIEKIMSDFGCDSRKTLKALSDSMRLNEEFVKKRDEVEDSARNLGFDLKTVCGFLYQERA